MTVKSEEKKRFSIIKRAKSFIHAGRGIFVFLRVTHNAWLHVVFFVIALCLGFLFEIEKTDWLALLIAAALVFVTEALNTAIEIHMDLTSPNHHPFAKDTKDVAAGAVLIAAIFALIVGIIIFLPHVALYLLEV